MSESRPLLVYSGPVDAVEILKKTIGSSFDVLRVEPNPDQVGPALRRARAFLDASMKVRIDAAMIDAAGNLQVVATATTGANHIDGAALTRRGIPLLTLRGQTEILKQLTPAAEHSWLLLMACARRLRAATEHVLSGGWDRVRFPGIMLKGRTLGVIGCGRIGQYMARYAQAFGMNVVGYDPFLTDWPAQILQVDLEHLLPNSDFVSIHVPFTIDSGTRNLLNRERLEAMKPGGIVINTSRGEVIDEAALLDLLRSGHIAGAALDVLAGEPDISEHPLRLYAHDNPNLIITPHIGGFSPEAVRMTVEFTGRRILRHFGFPS
jgi:D-3-phosphoglycerate dehydrogenase